MPSPVEAFRAVEGGQLRVVATMESLGDEVEFVREDLAATYRETDVESAYRTLMANRLAADDFQQVAGAGRLECQPFLFEEAIAFRFPSSRYEAVVVSFDRQRPFPFLDVVDAVGSVSHLSEGSGT